MGYSIRELRESEYPLLNDFLYEAIFIPEGMPPPPREIIYQPELQVYVADFGRHRGDTALVAEVEGCIASNTIASNTIESNAIVGAVWVRIMDDYGHIDDETPSFAISLYKDYRHRGIGTALMRAMLERLKADGYARASLAVQKANYAVKMYRKVGFTVVDENACEYIMLCDLRARG